VIFKKENSVVFFVLFCTIDEPDIKKSKDDIVDAIENLGAVIRKIHRVFMGFVEIDRMAQIDPDDAGSGIGFDDVPFIKGNENAFQLFPDFPVFRFEGIPQINRGALRPKQVLAERNLGIFGYL
jgi:hypothetical protein